MDIFTDATFQVEALADDETGEHCVVFSCKPDDKPGFRLYLTPEGAEEISGHFINALQAIRDDKT